MDFHYTNLTSNVGRKENLLDKLDKARRTNKKMGPMFGYLKSNVLRDSKGFSIITARPEELMQFAGDFERTFGVLSDKIKDRLSRIFYYSDYDKWSAYEVAKRIGVNVCPYCNRSYTFIVGSDREKGTRFQFDHFLSQSKYPFLALSFYNLIPSCHICNSNLKGSEDFSTTSNIHPYIEGFDNELLFSIRPKNIKFLNGVPSSYRIKFRRGNNATWDIDKVKAAFRNVVIFRLTKLYNMHKDYVDDLLVKSVIYNKAYIDSLFSQYGGTLFKNKDDVKRMVIGGYIEPRDYHKRVLSKLTADLAQELDLI